MKTCRLHLPHPTHGDMPLSAASELARAGLTFADVRLPSTHYGRWTYGPIRYLPTLDMLNIYAVRTGRSARHGKT